MYCFEVKKFRCYKETEYDTVVVIYINSTKTTFYFNFLFYQFSTAETHRHANKEKLLINTLFTCNLAIRETVVWYHY